MEGHKNINVQKKNMCMCMNAEDMSMLQVYLI